MMRRHTVLLIAGLLLGGCISDRAATGITDEQVDCSIPLEAIRRGDALVLIRSLRFVADTVRITAGRRVTWVNCEVAGADPHTTTAVDGTWDSPLLAGGAHFTREFAAAGTFDYFCRPHPTMRGTIIVD